MRSRSDTLGVSGVGHPPTATQRDHVEPAERAEPAQAEKVVGVTGQLFFYDWEASVLGPNGKVAGPNDPNVTCDSAAGGAGTAACGLTEYEAVIQGVEGARRAHVHEGPGRGEDALLQHRNHRRPVYYYVDAKTRRSMPRNGPEPTKALLDADIQHARIKLPKGRELVAVQPGTVLAQATTAPEVPVPNDFYVLRDNVKLTGQDISSPQVDTDPTQGIAVSFGFKNNGASVFTKVTAVLATGGTTTPSRCPTRTSSTSPSRSTGSSSRSRRSTSPVPVRDRRLERLGDHRRLHLATANTLANVMASGALPVKLDEISSELVTATLGHQALNQGLIAGLVGLALVALFLLSSTACSA
jgi:SecD/SecF fusion protein